MELAEAHRRGGGLLKQRLSQAMGRRPRIGRISLRGELQHQVEVGQAPQGIEVHPMQQQIPHSSPHDRQHRTVGRPVEGLQQPGRQTEILGFDRGDRHRGRPMERRPEGARYSRPIDIAPDGDRGITVTFQP